MKNVYFVTEGATDQIVLEGLIARWLGAADFVPRHIQPPSSAYADGLDSNLSTGWRGVLTWCAGRRPHGPAGRDEALRRADCLIIHTDADVATDADFKAPAYDGPFPPARGPCDWVRTHLTSLLGGTLPTNVVLCVPSMDMEACEKKPHDTASTGSGLLPDGPTVQVATHPAAPKARGLSLRQSRSWGYRSEILRHQYAGHMLPVGFP